MGKILPSLDYLHLDVFSPRAYGGNSLPVFMDTPDLSPAQMLAITQELRQFETIFLFPTKDTQSCRVRIFDLFEELPFAGHPVLGAAAALHLAEGSTESATWRFQLASKEVSVDVTRKTKGVCATMMDQGAAMIGAEVTARQDVSQAFSLAPADLHLDLPVEVISTGLSYLVGPVLSGVLPKARHAFDISEFLRGYGAQFVVLLDVEAREVRHWNNDGIIEDIATGSAAGTVATFLLRHELSASGKEVQLSQGRFAGRPSKLTVSAEGTPEKIHRVRVGGDVTLVGRGTLEASP